MKDKKVSQNLSQYPAFQGKHRKTVMFRDVKPNSDLKADLKHTSTTPTAGRV